MTRKTRSKLLAISLVASLLYAPTGAFAQPQEASPNGTTEALENLAALSGESSTDILGTSTDTPVSESADAFDLSIAETEISIPREADKPVKIGEGPETVEILRPADNQSEATAIAPGVVANEGEEFTTVTSVKNSGDVQIATIINDAESTERFEYQMLLPAGATMRETNGGVLIESENGDLIGGFTPPWAKDANGLEIPTRYEVDGNTLIQVVDHRSAKNLEYPVVADPAYSRGIIKEVKWERWNNGGWEIRFTVTSVARWYQPFNPSYVYKMGLDDLREHHPRSMAKATMAQQWECHVVGLPGTINIDLESKRKSWPGWRKGIAASVIKGNPAKACNW
ncbi:hypothetical protein [Glutamicibacter endophyticus]|uniref:hypothetical protein n=1 Tax=Glutamicibacter endophyticus TaxID=1522174 RepID=UPI003AF0DFC2